MAGREGTHVAVREGNIGLSPHVCNTAGRIDRALEVLNCSQS
jgi:hypothetical protein